MRSIYFAGDIINDTGPAIVNKQYLKIIGSELLYADANSKINRIIHAGRYLLFCKKLLVSSISSFHYRLILIAETTNKPTYYLMHGYAKLENQINQCPNPSHEKLEENILQKVGTIICVSETFAKSLIIERPDLAHKIFYVNNGTNHSHAPHKGVKKRRKTVMTVGGGVKRKNNLIVCKAIEKLNDKDIRFIVVGEIGADGPEMRKYPFVEWHSKLDRDSLYKVMQKSAVYIQASLFETFGLAVCEALDAGCKILVSKNVGAIDVIEGLGNINLISDPTDVGEIAMKISKLLDLSKNDKVKLQNDASWKNSASELLKIVGRK